MSDARWRLALEGSRLGRVFVLTLRGRIGARTSAAVVDAVAAAIDRGERHIVVDLESVDYISSAGLIALDTLSGRLTVAGGELVVCGVHHPAVRQAIELSGVLSRVSVEESREGAVRRLEDARRRTPSQ